MTGSGATPKRTSSEGSHAAGQGSGWVAHPVQPRCGLGAVKDDVEPVVVAEFLALGELAPGQLHPGRRLRVP